MCACMSGFVGGGKGRVQAAEGVGGATSWARKQRSILCGTDLVLFNYKVSFLPYKLLADTRIKYVMSHTCLLCFPLKSSWMVSYYLHLFGTPPFCIHICMARSQQSLLYEVCFASKLGIRQAYRSTF
jgi:hypothetical protein